MRYAQLTRSYKMDFSNNVTSKYKLKIEIHIIKKMLTIPQFYSIPKIIL